MDKGIGISLMHIQHTDYSCVRNRRFSMYTNNRGWWEVRMDFNGVGICVGDSKLHLCIQVKSNEHFISHLGDGKLNNSIPCLIVLME